MEYWDSALTQSCAAYALSAAATEGSKAEGACAEAASDKNVETQTMANDSFMEPPEDVQVHVESSRSEARSCGTIVTN